MCDYLKQSKPNYIDDQTECIVNGFIRSAQTFDSISLIPSEILFITLLYVDDHFMMDRGSFQWQITDLQLMQNILCAQTEQEFTSDAFEVGKLQWIIKLIPNGKDGELSVYVANLSLPKTWTVGICHVIKCKQLNISAVVMTMYGRAQSWGSSLLSFNDFQNINPKQLTFDVTVRIVRIMTQKGIKYQSKINNYRKEYQLKWTMNNNKTYTDRIFSDIIDGMFCAFYSLEHTAIGVMLCGLPNKEQRNGYVMNAIQIQLTCHIIEANIMQSQVRTLQLTEMALIQIPSFKLDDFKQCEEIHFVVDIKILNEYDLDGNVIGLNIENEWDKFVGKEQKIGEIEPIGKTRPKTPKQVRTEVILLLDTLREMMDEVKEIVMNKSIKQKDFDSYAYEKEQFKLWLKNNVKLDQYYHTLIENGFDTLDAVQTINIHELKEIGVTKIGHRKQFIKHVNQLNGNKSNDNQTNTIIVVLVGLLCLVVLQQMFNF